MKVYSIRDSKSQSHQMPWYRQTQGEAERFLLDIMGEDPSKLPAPYNHVAKYSHDFDMYYLGEFDPSSGKFKLLDAPQHVINCDQLKSVLKPELKQ